MIGYGVSNKAIVSEGMNALPAKILFNKQDLPLLSLARPMPARIKSGNLRAKLIIYTGNSCLFICLRFISLIICAGIDLFRYENDIAINV